MGRGDKKTRRGKIFKGSYGNSRPQTSGEIKGSSASDATSAKKASSSKKGK